MHITATRLKLFNLNPPHSELTEKVKLTMRKKPFRLSRLTNELADERSTTGFRFKHCSPSGEGRAKGEFKGFIKEDLSKRLKGPKIGLCKQQLAAIIISTS